ncbi:MAG: YdcF family protein [Planctomycetota bacterium]
MKFIRAAISAASLFLAAFITANFVGENVSPGFSADYFWILPIGFPLKVWTVLKLAFAAFLLIRLFVRKPLPNLIMFFMLSVFGVFLAAAASNIYQFYGLLAAGIIHSPAVLPFSLLVILLIIGNIALVIKPDLGIPRTFEKGAKNLLRLAFAIMLVGGLIPLGLILTMGPTDYARPADVAVVLGAKAYSDGTPSLALDDRVRTGIELYRRGLVRKLIMTGGTGVEGVSEPEVMKRIAMEAGVPEFNIIIDGNGNSTSDSAKNCRAIMEKRGYRTALAVSHYYHTPRIKLLFAREGIPCYVVPAKMTRRLRKEPILVLRECVAIYYHYLLTWKRA